MADRLDFYFRQRVTEAELDLAFDQLEAADQYIAADLGIHGIISGAMPAPRDPVADLTIDLGAPAKAYDNLGQRIFFGVDQRVDCSVDFNGLPTEVIQAAKARWLGVFLRFERRLSDPRTDGNSQEVFFRRDEGFELRVRMAPEADVATAPRVPLVESELLVCDVIRRHGQTQIVDTDIDLSRRQAFIFAAGESVEAQTGLWKVLTPASATVQASLDAVDAALDDHLSGRTRHPASDVEFVPTAGVRARDLQAAVVELVGHLASDDDTSPGSRWIGARALPGAPHALGAARVDDQMERLLGWLNAHIARPAGAHHASAIAATPHHFLQRQSVQGQLEELIDELKSFNPSLGSAQIGSAAIPGATRTLARGSVREQLARLLAFLEAHASSSDHDQRYYRAGAQVADSARLDGRLAGEYALSGHVHDDRYLRRVYQSSSLMDPGQQRVFVTLEDPPQLVTVAYNLVDAQGLPDATTHVMGPFTPALNCWVTKLNQSGGDKDYRVTVRNNAPLRLYISVAAYGVD